MHYLRVCMRVHVYVYVRVCEQTLAHIAHLRQECHNSILVIFQKKSLNDLKCYTFL